MVSSTIQGLTVHIEALYEVAKRLAIAQKYKRLRKELGVDVCLMLDLDEMLRKRGVIEADNDAPTAVETQTYLMPFTTLPTPSVGLLRAVYRGINHAS